MPPFECTTNNGVTFTIGNICHQYSGTVSGLVKGVQYTVILPDGSRLVAGQETLYGSVADSHGKAELLFSGTRACVPDCPANVHLWSVSGEGDLEI